MCRLSIELFTVIESQTTEPYSIIGLISEQCKAFKRDISLNSTNTRLIKPNFLSTL